MDDTPSFVTLKDGRKLCYGVYGEGGSEKAIVYHHGFASSRLEARMMHEDALKRGLRLIAFDRPGYGLSTYDPTITLDRIADDVKELLDGLELNGPVIMMGISAGAPYAAQCAALLPQKTCSLCLVVPWAQLKHQPRGLTADISWSEKLLLHSTWLLMRIRFGRALFLKLLRFAKEDASAVNDHKDKAGMLFESIREGLRAGIKGAAREIQVLEQPPSEVLQTVSCKTVIWAGGKDITNPLTMAEVYRNAIKNSEMHVVPDGGHFLGFKADAQILQSVTLTV